MEDNEWSYNGWPNRSTWLAVVHLENTSKEVWEEALRIVRNDLIITSDLENLLTSRTSFNLETDKDKRNIAWKPVIDRLQESAKDN